MFLLKPFWFQGRTEIVWFCDLGVLEYLLASIRFDVAGAGACLKRYTDPSFFKMEAASSGMGTVEIQREKKNRKVKVF